MEIVRTRIYDRKVRKLLGEKEALAVENDIAASPAKWPVVQGTGGIRKARAGRGSSGKSGGVRILYYLWASDSMIYLLDVYAKNEQANISRADKKFLKSMIEALKRER